MLHGYDSTEAICGELMEENRKLKEEIEALKSLIPPCKVGDALFFFTSPEYGVRRYPDAIGAVVLAEDGWYVVDEMEAADVLWHCEKVNTRHSYLSYELAEQAMKGGAE